jgi:hypothetical protein
MSNFDIYLKELQKLIDETPVDQRDQVWKEVLDLQIKGPTVDQYLESVTSNFSDLYKELTIRPSFVDDILFSTFFAQSIGSIIMEEKVQIQSVNNLASEFKTDCNTVEGHECVYPLAA